MSVMFIYEVHYIVTACVFRSLVRVVCNVYARMGIVWPVVGFDLEMKLASP